MRPYTTARPAASVGVVTPEKIPPRIMTGMKSAGAQPMKLRQISFQDDRSPPTSQPVFLPTQTATSIMAMAKTTPGTNPDRNSSLTETFPTNPYTSSGMLGGTMMPMVPAAATKAAAKGFE